MRQIVEVKWVDSTHMGGWSPTEKLQNDAHGKTVECKTVGYLLAKEEDRIAVVQNMSEDEEISDSLMVIPMRSVLEIRYLGATTPVGTTGG